MLSIIIPTLNEETFLPKLLDSLNKQTFRDFEVIVADALSQDKTRAIAAEHGCRVVDGGLPAAGRNNGAAAARGELLLFLDADVVLNDERMLEKTVGEFKSLNLDLATGFIAPFPRDLADVFMCGFYNFYIYITQKIFPHAHGFFIIARRSIHNAIKGFDPEVLLAEDHDYAQRAVKAGAVFGVLRSVRINVSARRFARDGHLRTSIRYVLCEIYMWFFGSVKTDIFRYRFGYSKELANKYSKYN